MKKFLLTLQAFFFVFLVNNVGAQVTISASNETVCAGDIVTVEISVNNFDSVSAFSFPVVWDTDVLSYIDFSLEVPALAATFGENEANAPAGFVTFGWFDPGAPFDFSLPDGTVILKLRFNVVGNYVAPDDFTLIDLTDPSTGINSEVFQYGNIIPSPDAMFVDGSVTVVDAEAPMANDCPTDTVVIVGIGSPGTNVLWTPPTATDNCDPTPTLTPSQMSGTFFPVGTTNVLYTVTDDAGNSNTSCSFNVIVEEELYTFVASDEAIPCDENTVSVTISLENFNDVDAFQFALQWDTSILTFTSFMPDPTFPPLLGDNSSGVASGFLLINWNNSSMTSIDFPNGQPVITVNFNVDVVDLAAAGSTMVEFVSFPFFQIKVITGSSGNVPQANIALDHSTITMGDNPPDIVCPSNISVDTDPGTCSAMASWSDPTVTDDCDTPPPSPVQIDGLSSGSNFPVGIDTIKYVATDSSMQSDTCMFMVTVTDNQPPTLDCPASDIVMDNDAGMCSAIVSWTVTYSDNCGIVSVDSSHASGSSFPVGTTTVSYKVKDSVDSTECSFDIVVNDVEPPSLICPASDIVMDNDPGVCNAVASWTVTYSDNCGVVSVDSSHASGSAFSVGTTTISYKVKDAVDSTECSFNVVVNDVELPSIVCPDNQIVAINAMCEAVLVDYTGMTMSLSDNCTDSVTMEMAMVQTPAAGTTISTAVDVELEVQDDAGNSNSCTFKVTPDDQTPPTSSCFQDTTVYLDISGVVSIDSSFLDSNSMDNCMGITMSLDISTFDCSDIGNNTVTLTVTDVNGNTDDCVTNVIVSDNLPPELVQCQSDTFVIADANCEAVLPDFTPSVLFDDNCTDYDDLKITQIPPPGAVVTMDTTIAVVALDSVGVISDTCFFLVELRDTTPPSITCPADIVATTDLDSCNAVVMWSMPTATDNCGVASVSCDPMSGAIFPIGSSTVTCTAVDLSGNMETCEFMVTVNDGQIPFLACPPDITVFVPSGVMDTMIFDIGLDSLSDNCGVDTSYFNLTDATTGDGDADASGTSFNVGTTVVTYYAEDEAGNIDSCSFNVIVMESMMLNLTCPANYTVSADAGECSAVLDTDAPSIDPMAALDVISYVLIDSTTGSGPDSVPDMQAFGVGITTVTYTAVSVTDDTSACSFTVTVTDQEDPVITCPMTIIELDNTTDSCGVLFDASFQMATASDNCPGLAMSYNFAIGDLILVGDNMITATATDQANNTADCSYQVTVRDTQPPTIINCPANIMVNNDQNLCGATVTWTPPTAEDNCGVLLLESTPYLPGDFIPVGAEFITYTASDFTGNITECIFSVTVRDNQPPNLNPCPGNITVPNEPGICSADVSWPFISPSDNCNVVSFVVLPQSGSTFPIGQTSVQAVATDGAGNVTVCSFSVTVLDSEFPTMDNFPGNMTLDSDPGECGAVVSWPIITVDDNCGIDTFHCDADPGDFFPVGMTDVECTVTDINGNAVNRIFTVTVEDNELPVVDCPEDILVFVDSSVIDDQSGFLNGFQAVTCDSLIFDYNSLSASDNCGIAAVSQTSGPVSGSPIEAGMHTLTYLVTDVNGNQTVCGFNITIENIPDATAIAFPNNPCEGEDVLFSTTDYVGAEYDWRDPLGTMISNQPSFTLTNMTVAMSGTYTVTITFPFNCVQTAQVDVTVFPMPNLGIEHNDLLCASAGADLTLEAIDTANSGITNYVWDTPGAAVFFGNPITIVSPEQGTYTVTATTGNGCSSTTSVFIEITAVPKTPDLTGSATETCVGESVELDGEEFAGPDIEYHWSASPNLTDAGLIDIDNHDNEANPVGPGVYTYYYYVTQGGCISDSAEWVVVVEDFPSFDLDSMVLGNMDCVDGTTDIVIAPMNTMAGLDWSLDVNGNCPATQVDSMFTLNNIDSDCNGIYVLTATSPIGCSTSLDVELDITDKPVTPALQLTDDVICMGGSTTMFLTNVPSGANTLCYADGVPVSCAILGNPTQVPATTTYGVQYDINGCMSDTALVTVTVEAPVDVPIEVIGDVTCVDGTGTVTLTTPASGDTYVWDGPCGVQVGNDLEIPNINAACSGLYSVSVTGSLGQCISIGTLQLEVTGMLGEVTAEVLGPVCEGGDIEFCAEPNMTGATYTWTDPFGNVFSNERCPTTAAIAADAPYSVLVEMNGCTSSDDTLVSFLTAPIANDETVIGVVDTPQSFDVVENDSVPTGNYTITVKQQPSHGEVSYNGDGVFTYTPQEGFRETDVMAYEICLDECPNLCDLAIVTILVRYPIDQCIATTVITPNQDGINDEFVVSCLELGGCPNNQLFIFNQWGDQVFEAAPYDNTWKGTYNDKDVPDGTYFYIFKCDNSTPAEKGFVVIHR